METLSLNQIMTPSVMKELFSTANCDWQPALVAVAIETGQLSLSPEEALLHVHFNDNPFLQ